MRASLISPKTQAGALPYDWVTHAERGLACLRSAGSRSEIFQEVRAGQKDEDKGITHLGMRLF